jgi:hypothetical protein
VLLCEFCDQYKKNGGECRLGLPLPKRMSCRDFDPGVEGFCSNPADFVSAAQVLQMAVYFDIKGAELKKVRLMAAREVETRERGEPAPAEEARFTRPGGEWPRTR